MALYTNQRDIISSKPLEVEPPYITISEDDFYLAWRTLKPTTVGIWIYLVKNRPGFRLGFSPRQIRELMGINEKTSKNSIRELEEKGYLTRVDDTTYICHSRPCEEQTCDCSDNYEDSVYYGDYVEKNDDFEKAQLEVGVNYPHPRGKLPPPSGNLTPTLGAFNPHPRGLLPLPSGNLTPTLGVNYPHPRGQRPPHTSKQSISTSNSNLFYKGTDTEGQSRAEQRVAHEGAPRVSEDVIGSGMVEGGRNEHGTEDEEPKKTNGKEDENKELEDGKSKTIYDMSLEELEDMSRRYRARELFTSLCERYGLSPGSLSKETFSNEIPEIIGTMRKEKESERREKAESGRELHSLSQDEAANVILSVIGEDSDKIRFTKYGVPMIDDVLVEGEIRECLRNTMGVRERDIESEDEDCVRFVVLRAYGMA